MEISQNYNSVTEINNPDECCQEGTVIEKELILNRNILTNKNNADIATNVKEYGEILNHQKQDSSLTDFIGENASTQAKKDGEACEKWTSEIFLFKRFQDKTKRAIEKVSSDSSNRAVLHQSTNVKRGTVSDQFFMNRLGLIDNACKETTKGSNVGSNSKSSDIKEINSKSSLSKFEQIEDFVLHSNDSSDCALSENEPKKSSQTLCKDDKLKATPFLGNLPLIKNVQKNELNESGETSLGDIENCQPRTRPAKKDNFGKRMRDFFMKLTRQRADDKIIFPNNLDGFGLAFNDEGVLCSPSTGDQYSYYQFPSRAMNDAAFRSLCQVVNIHIYQMMEKKEIFRVNLPVLPALPADKSVHKERENNKMRPSSFSYQSNDTCFNQDRLLVLINNGTCAGQWSTSVIIKEGLQQGSQLPFIDRAKSEGYAVVILDYSVACQEIGDTKLNKNQLKQHIDYASFVFSRILNDSPAKNIAFIANGNGGLIVSGLSKMYPEQFAERVYAIALIDSPRTTYTFALLQLKAVNWLASEKPLGVVLCKPGRMCMEVSAGHTDVQWTCWSSFEEIFRFLQQRYDEMNVTCEELV